MHDFVYFYLFYFIIIIYKTDRESTFEKWKLLFFAMYNVFSIFNFRVGLILIQI